MGAVEDDQKPAKLQKALELLPSSDQEKAKPISKPPPKPVLKLNLGALLNQPKEKEKPKD